MRRQQKHHHHHQQQGEADEKEKEKEYLNFINSIRSEATIKVYRLSISHYMRFINIRQQDKRATNNFIPS
jgi:hypothetical protein